MEMFGGYLIHASGDPPCAAVVDTLFINIIDPEQPSSMVSAQVCDCDKALTLESLLPFAPTPAAFWTDDEGEMVGNVIDSGNYGANTALPFVDMGGVNSAFCFRDVTLNIDIFGLEVTTYPEDQVGEVGGSVQFVVDAAESGAVFQWEGEAGNAWQPLTNEWQYSGVNTPVLTVLNITILNNNGLY